MVHRADLRYSFFPLNDPESSESLINSWKAKLANLPPLLSKIHSAYQAYLDLPAKSQDISYRQKAELGVAITMPKWEQNDSTKTNEERLKRLEKIVSGENFPEELRIKAEYNLIEHKVKHSIMEPTVPPIPYSPEEARADYNRLLDMPAADPATRASIIYHLAELDDEGKGLPDSAKEADREAARKRFAEVLEDKYSHPFTKHLAQLKLKKMDQTAK